MDNVINTIKAQLYEKIRSPLSGTFIISWCIWNWKFIAVFFSNMQVIEKIDYINNEIFPDMYSYLYSGFFYPFISAALFILIYQFPARWAYHYWKLQQRAIKEIRQKIEDEEPLTVEEARQIRKDAIETKNKLELQLVNEIKKTKDLEIQLENASKELSKVTKSNNIALSSTINLKDKKTKQDILKLLNFIENTSQLRQEGLINQSLELMKIEKVNLMHYIDFFKSKEIITIDSNGFYGLTPEGRKIIIDQDISSLEN